MTESDRIRDYFRTTKWRASAGREYLMSERTVLLWAAAATLGRPVEELSVCDVGCGGGVDLVAWRDAGVPEKNLAGTELVHERAAIARERLPLADIREVEGFDLPFATASMDVTSASLVLSTIRFPSARRRLLTEMERITRPGGVVLVYDFAVRKPWNRSVRAVTSRQLRRLLRPPDRIMRAAPVLPLLDLAHRLPAGVRRAIIAGLPRTHRLWVWRMPPSVDDRGRT
jgi:ubiquinone/menaquinone biosynthesis C-methylase UbiE